MNTESSTNIPIIPTLYFESVQFFHQDLLGILPESIRILLLLLVTPHLMSGAIDLLPFCWIITVPLGGILGRDLGAKFGKALQAQNFARLKETFLANAKTHKGPSFQIVAPGNKLFLSVPHILHGVETTKMIPFVSMDSDANAKRLIGRYENGPEERAMIQRSHNLNLYSLPVSISKFTLRTFEGPFYSVEHKGSTMAALTVAELVDAVHSKQTNQEKSNAHFGIVAGLVLGVLLPFPFLLD